MKKLFSLSKDFLKTKSGDLKTFAEEKTSQEKY